MGVEMNFLPDGKPERVHAVLMMLTADTPATTKALGLSATASNSSCSKCTERWKSVPGRGPAVLVNTYDLKPEYRNKTRARHIEYGKKWQNATTIKERKDIVSKYGFRQTCFTSDKIKYFAPGVMHAVDAMHCLLIGMFKALFVQCTNI